MIKSIVQLLNITKTFPGSIAVSALRGLDLEIRRGEMTAIVGPSGAGKSTLLNILGLLDVPTSGRYLLNGTDTSRLGERELTSLRAVTLGFVFQAFHLLPHLNCVGNVMLPLAHQGWPRRERARLATEALVRVGLGHRLDARPATLSGGERQRVAVARAVVHSPSVILCDEPTGNLDRENSTQVMDLLRRQVTPERSLIIVTHDDAASACADRVVKVVDGVVC
ncbi:ABC transporter ATP-binding protein [Salinispora cortesiana]|uniref:ABC transporter ATP-binding protein n=1 Tax=Salinispora cortesiana TaxID=1305843 RepID=UPI0012BBA5A5|nr:ABC transporter ATP-binding protein [Salinispora cortesiana]